MESQRTGLCYIRTQPLAELLADPVVYSQMWIILYVLMVVLMRRVLKCMKMCPKKMLKKKKNALVSKTF